MAEEEDNDEVVDAMASRLETLDADGEQEEDEEEANADGMAEANADGANGPPLSAVVARLSALDALVAAERAAAAAAAARRHDPSLFDGACAALTLALEACGPQGDEVRARGAELARMLSGGAAESSSGGGDGQQEKEKKKEKEKEKIEPSQIRQPQHCIPCHTVMVGDLVRRVSAPATKAKFDWIRCSYLARSFSPSCICCCLVLINCCMFYQIMISYKCLFSTFQKHADVTVQQLYITKGVYIT